MTTTNEAIASKAITSEVSITKDASDKDERRAPSSEENNNNDTTQTRTLAQKMLASAEDHAVRGIEVANRDAVADANADADDETGTPRAACHVHDIVSKFTLAETKK